MLKYECTSISNRILPHDFILINLPMYNLEISTNKLIII